MTKKVSCPSLACLSSEDPGVTGSAEDSQAAASLEGSPRYGGRLMEAALLHLPAQLPASSSTREESNFLRHCQLFS